MKLGKVFAVCLTLLLLAAAPQLSAQDAEAAARDSTLSPGDTAGAEPPLAAADSAVGVPDSVAARFPVTAAEDSATAVRDSVPAPGDAETVPLDTDLRGNTLSWTGRVFGLDYSEADREEIQEFVSSNPAEALAMDAGIRYITRGFYGGPQYIGVRGRDPNNSVFLLDGVPVTDPQIEVFDPHWLPLEGIERMEVLKGPSSALFGGGATGGTFNAVSQDILLPVPLTRLNVWFGSFDTRLVGASFSRSVGRNFGFMGAYDYFKTDGYVHGAGYKGEKLYGKVSARFASSLKLDVAAYRHVGDTGVLGTDYTDRLDDRTFLDISCELGKGSVFDVDLYYFDIGETFRGSTQDTYEGSQAGASVVWTSDETSRHLRRLGASFKRKNTTAVDGIAEGSAFGQVAYTSGDLAGEALLRVEKNSQHDFQYAFSFPLDYGLGRGLRLYGRLDRGFSYPIATTATRGRSTERVFGASGGIIFDLNALRVSLNVYYYDVKGATVYRTDDTCRIFRLEDAALDIPGAEVEIYVPPVYGFEGTISYSLCDANEAVEDGGEGQPLNVLAWGVRYRRQFTQHIGMGLAFAGRWLSGTSLGHRWQCIDEDCLGQECVSDASLPAVRSAQVYAFLSIDESRTFIRIRNLFNESMPIAWDRPSLPERSYEFGLTWDLHN